MLALPFLLDRLFLAGLRIPLNYNEGWNAYHTLRVMRGGSLYPPLDGLVVNNYPPLSFLVVAGVGGIVPDLVFAGRLVATVSFAVVVLNIGLIVRTLTRSGAAGAFGAALFMAMFAIFCGRYIGMDDPQMLAHALMTTALLVCVRRWESRPAIIGALLLMLAAGLTKHNLVALPLALVATSFMMSARRGWAILATGAGLVALGVGLLVLAFGRIALASLVVPRSWSAFDAAASAGQWMLPMAPLLALLLLALWWRPVTGPDRLVVCYALVAIPVALLLAGGAGVRENIWFDLLIASTIVATVTVTRLLSHGSTALPLALCVAPAIGVLPALPSLKWRWVDGNVAAQRQATRQDVARLAAGGAPALCEMLSLCYWAGVPEEADLFNADQGFRTGRLTPSLLEGPLSEGRFRIVQLGPSSAASERWSAALDSVLLSRYRLEATSANGRIFVPR